MRQPATDPPETAPGAGADMLRRLLGDRSLVFVGLMGAGKTAIGRRLAQICGLSFVDSDHEIELASRMRVPDLFETYGEAEFRSLERRVMARLLKGGPQVVSTGGGAFMNERTRAAIARSGVSVWLKADLDLLMDRVSRKQDRPLLRNADPRSVMRALIESRHPVYALADVAVESEEIGKDEMANKVIEAVVGHLRADAGSTAEPGR